MLAHDFGNGVALMRLLRLLLEQKFSVKNSKFYTHPTQNRQFGWGASANFVVQ